MKKNELTKYVTDINIVELLVRINKFHGWNSILGLHEKRLKTVKDKNYLSMNASFATLLSIQFKKIEISNFVLNKSNSDIEKFKTIGVFSNFVSKLKKLSFKEITDYKNIKLFFEEVLDTKFSLEESTNLKLAIVNYNNNVSNYPDFLIVSIIIFAMDLLSLTDFTIMTAILIMCIMESLLHKIELDLLIYESIFNQFSQAKSAFIRMTNNIRRTTDLPANSRHRRNLFNFIMNHISGSYVALYKNIEKRINKSKPTNKKQTIINEILQIKSEFSNSDVVKKISFSSDPSYISVILASILKQGLIKKIGRGKSTKYKVVEK